MVIGSSRASQMTIIEDETMNQNIEQVSHPRDAINKELFDKCMNKLTGADKLAELIDGVMANSITSKPKSYDDIMSDIGNSFDSFEPALLEAEPFTMQPFERPRYLDRSCMVKFDVTKIP